eukprot:TRINITY_DN15752_c1_g1_i1.p1 TRINITY_DN15752_c1_g1~~TRINITY_DN15752_c1_g1_i1.p1  ORF type:complete len:599 (+),score=100.04 TRINITY_DN15752_c1_g1_i1:87-1883(+)
MGDQQSKNNNSGDGGDDLERVKTRERGTSNAANQKRGQALMQHDGRRRARTTGADTKDMLVFEKLAREGENPTIKDPKSVRILGMRFLDPSVSSCTNCKVSFTTTNRRHWCRRCGRIFCDLCASKRQQLYTGGPEMRVCRGCAAPLAFRIPINVLQRIFSFFTDDTAAVCMATCHRFQLGVNLPYREVRDVHETFDKKATKYLQKGAFGCVYAAVSKKDRAPAAIKVINKHNVHTLREWNFIRREIQLHRDLCHENIVRLADVCQTRSKVYIIMELGKGDLFDFMMKKGYMTESEVINIGRQLLAALVYLHETAHTVHRDIKPENILIFPSGDLSNPVVKLCDFGLGKTFDASALQTAKVSCTPCGTLSYCPPEVLAKTQSVTIERLCKLDIFSLGIVLHVLISGVEPFKGKSPAELLSSMRKPLEPQGDEWGFITKPMKKLVVSMLSYSSKSRPNASQALTAISQIEQESCSGEDTAIKASSPDRLVPLIDKEEFKSRVAASVSNSFEFRMQESADATDELQIDKVPRPARRREGDSIPEDLLDVHKKLELGCFADELGSLRLSPKYDRPKENVRSSTPPPPRSAAILIREPRTQDP